MRSEGYGSRRVSVSVCLSVCVSVKSHLTSGASVRREKFVAISLKLLRCRDRALPPMMAIHRVGIFPGDNTHAHCAYASSPRLRCDARAPCRKFYIALR